MIVIANVLPKLQTTKILFRHLSKKRCVRTRFDSQLVKASQMLVQSPWERFGIFLIILKKIDLEIDCPSVRWSLSGVC